MDNILRKNNIINNISNSQLGRFTLFFIVLLLLSFLMIVWYYPESGVVSSGGTDLMFHANRFYGLIEAINNGSYPYYINAESLDGYGYAANLFYPDLMLVPFALLAPFLGFASPYKLMIFTYTVLCGIFSYLAIIRVTKKSVIAFLFSILYTFAIYRLIDFSYRGALGEFISFTFLPIIFWGLYEILFGDHVHRWYIISLGFTCLIYTHLLSALLIFVFVCLAIIINCKAVIRNPFRLLSLALAGGATVLLSLAFLLPMFEQLDSNSFYFQTHPLANAIGPQSVELRRVLWGVFNGLTDHKLRIETIGIVLIIPLLFRLSISGYHKYLRLADVCTIISLILIFALSDMFPWYTFPFNKLTILQFPFRLLQPASFLLALSGAIYLSIVSKQTNRNIIFIAAIVLLIGYSLRITGGVYQGYGIYTVNNKEGHNLDTYEIVGAEYLPSKIPSTKTDDIRYRIQYIIDRGDLVSVDESVTTISNINRNKSILTVETVQSQPDKLTMPLLYYKGYKANIDGQEIEVTESKDGLVEILSPSSGKITVWYDGTSVQRISLLISGISFFIFLVYAFFCRKQYHRKSENKQISTDIN